MDIELGEVVGKRFRMCQLCEALGGVGLLPDPTAFNGVAT